MKKKYELGRFAILRRSDHFEIVSPAGGIYSFDEKSIKKLLNFHGKIPSIKKSNLEVTALKEGLLLRSSQPKQPFQIKKVLNNINDKSKNILTLSDLAIIITKKCNYNCLGCSVDAGISKNTKNVNWKKIISDGASFGAINLAISGGEPLLPDGIEKVLELARFAKKCGYENIVIYTNGTFVSKYAQKLKKSGVTRISISFHGFDGYSEKYTKHPNAEINSFSGIKATIKAGLYLRVNCVVTKGNIFQVEHIIKELIPIIKGDEENYLRFSPVIEIGRASNKKNNLSIDEYNKLITIVAKYKPKYGEKIRLTCDEECFVDDPVFCDAGLVCAIVNEKGIISPCDLLESISPIDSIGEKDFIDIWNDNNKWGNFRKVIEINPVCGSCEKSIRKICIGKCKALALIKFGSLTMNKEPKKCLHKSLNKRKGVSI